MSALTQLWLHVGYGKTGSTSLQAWLASHQDFLVGEGVHYPLPTFEFGDSGNGSLLLEALKHPHRQPSWLQTARDAKAILFSREHLAREFSAPGACVQLAECCKFWGLAPIRIILFVRDPHEHCYSLWAQKVKLAGERRSLHDFASSYDAIDMASRFIESAVECGFQLEVVDYGKHRRNLVNRFSQWLDLENRLNLKPIEFLLANPTPRHGQLRLQYRLNRLWPGGYAPLPPRWLSLCAEPRHGSVRFSEEQRYRWQEKVAMFNSLCDQSDVISEAMPFATTCFLYNTGNIHIK